MDMCYRYPRAEKCANCGWNMRSAAASSAESLSEFDYCASELTATEREILESWMPTDNELLSRPVCRDCARIVSSLEGAPRPVPRQLGHSGVCAACGDLIAKTARCRSRPLDLTQPEQRHIFAECLKPQPQLQDKDRDIKVCRACVKAAKRALEIKQDQKNPDEAITSPPPPINPVINLSHRPGTSAGKQIIDENGKVCTLVDEIEMKGRYNVRGKVGSCTICNKPANNILDMATRRKLVLQRNIYVNPSANFCDEHKKMSVSRLPINKDHWTSMFNSEEIPDMLFLLKVERPIDFNKIEKLDPYYLDKWIGMSLDEFQWILDENPALASHANGKFALAVWLAGKHAREGERALASVTQRTVDDVRAAWRLADDTLSAKTKRDCTHVNEVKGPNKWR